MWSFTSGGGALLPHLHLIGYLLERDLLLLQPRRAEGAAVGVHDFPSGVFGERLQRRRVEAFFRTCVRHTPPQTPAAFRDSYPHPTERLPSHNETQRALGSPLPVTQQKACLGNDGLAGQQRRLDSAKLVMRPRVIDSDHNGAGMRQEGLCQAARPCHSR